MIDSPQHYSINIARFVHLTPSGSLGPWQSYTMDDFFSIVQNHMPDEVMWNCVGKVVQQRAPSIKDIQDLSKFLMSLGVPDHHIRLNIKAYEHVRHIFCGVNGFEYKPIPAGTKVLPQALTFSKDGDYRKTKVKDFYEICYCGNCNAMRSEIDRQKRVARGEEYDDDENN